MHQWKMMYSGAWTMWKESLNTLRKSEMNLPAITEGFIDHMNKMPNKPKYTLTAYSANLFDRPADWYYILESSYNLELTTCLHRPETDILIGPIKQTTDQKYDPPQDVVSHHYNPYMEITEDRLL
jgi:hypothetical protein